MNTGENALMGSSYFFVGVVEDVNDPLQANRVRVRAIGYHPEMADGGVPTRDLPWALVGLPTTASGVSGIGSTHGLKDGSWVFGMFIDGRDAQQPMIMVSLAGAPGFSSLQKEKMRSGYGLSSPGQGGLGGGFQTMSGSTAGGIGNGSKYGAVLGSVMSIANIVKNDDALKTLIQVTAPAISRNTPIQNVIDSSQASLIKNSSVISNLPQGKFSTSLPIPNSILNLFKVGGAKGPETDGILGSSLFGTMSDNSNKTTGKDLTVTVQTDFDSLLNGTSDIKAVTIHSTNTPKGQSYSVSSLSKESPSGKIGYHLLIDTTGQILKTKDAQSPGSHTPGFESVTVGGSSGQNFGIALVGGKNTGKGSLDSMFYIVQLQVLEKLLHAIVRKFPKAVITGANELTKTASPGFNISEWGSTLFPKNVNTTDAGRQLPGDGTETIPSKTLPNFNGISSGSATGEGYDESSDRTPSGTQRGFEGGPHRPDPKYASRRNSDVPAMARTNSYTLGSSAGGSPEKMYLSKLEEVSQSSHQYPRPSDTLAARSVPETWKVPKYPHGGEYAQAHVVRSTEGGHHILLDDTSGRQKVEIMHSTGSSLQIHSDGSGVFYLKKDGYEIVIGDKHLGINGSLNVSVGGDMKVSVKGDLIYDVGGDVKYNISGKKNEFIRSDSTSVVEGSRSSVTKKGSVERIAKDRDVSVGGKSSEHIVGNKTTDVRGNKSEVTRAESNEYVGGNKSVLARGASTTHAQTVIEQSVGESIKVAGGNSIISTKGKMTVTSGGDTLMSSGAKTSMVSAGVTNIKASGNLNADGAQVNINSGLAIVSSVTPADVDQSNELTPESNISDSSSNLSAEQPVRGEIDRLEAMDNAGESGSSPSSSLNSGGANASSDGGDFTPAEVGEAIEAGKLGNNRVSACAIAESMVSKGWSKYGASAIVGNMQQESSFNPSSSALDTNNRISSGLISWQKDRLDNLKSYAASKGLEWNTVDAQLGYLDYEARHSESSSGSKMINASDLESALKGSAQYIRFQGYRSAETGVYTGDYWGKGNGNRAAQTLAVYNECFGGNETSIGTVKSGTIEAFKGGTSGNSASGGGGSSGGGAGGGGGGGDNSSPKANGAAEVVPGSGEPREPYASTADTSGPINWGMKVSPHFTLGQLCPTSKFVEGQNATGDGHISHTDIILNLSACATNVVERLYQQFGHVHVNSGYRSLAYNNSLRSRGGGQAKNSDHMKGKATDVMVSGVSPREVANWIEANIKGIAGIGRYPTFTHISWDRNGNHGKIRRWGRN